MNKEQVCEICGCADESACEGGCYWVAEELCSRCADRLIDQNKELQSSLDIANKKLDKIKKYTLKHRVDWGDPESQDGEDWELDGNDILEIIGGE